MRQWIGGTAAVWPEPSWQIYALPRRRAVREMAAAYRPAVEKFDELSPVDDEDLHMTVQPLPGWSSEWSAAALEEIAAALRSDLAQATPVEVMLGPALAGSSGIVLDPDAVTDGPLHGLYQRVRRVLAGVLDAELPPSGWPAHMSLAYCRRDRDSGDMQSALRRQREIVRADWTISELTLVQVHQDAHAHRYTWPHAREIAIPIGQQLAT